MSAAAFVGSWILLVPFVLPFLRTASCHTGYSYVLDTEYTESDFFNGWEFFTVRASAECPLDMKDS